MDSLQLEQIVRQLWTEREQFRAELERQRNTIASLRRDLENLALAVCLSDDQGLREWAAEFGECHPQVDRKIESKVSRYESYDEFCRPALLADFEARAAT